MYWLFKNGCRQWGQKLQILEGLFNKNKFEAWKREKQMDFSIERTIRILETKYVNKWYLS